MKSTLCTISFHLVNPLTQRNQTFAREDTSNKYTKNTHTRPFAFAMQFRVSWNKVYNCANCGQLYVGHELLSIKLVRSNGIHTWPACKTHYETIKSEFYKPNDSLPPHFPSPKVHQFSCRFWFCSRARLSCLFCQHKYWKFKSQWGFRSEEIF